MDTTSFIGAVQAIRSVSSDCVEISSSRCWNLMKLPLCSCQTISEDDCLPMDQFAVHLLPHLLHLASDKVPNVRVLLAKTLKQTLLEKGWWQESQWADWMGVFCPSVFLKSAGKEEAASDVGCCCFYSVFGVRYYLGWHEAMTSVWYPTCCCVTLKKWVLCHMPACSFGVIFHERATLLEVSSESTSEQLAAVKLLPFI